MKRFAKVIAVLVAILMIAFVVFRTPDTDPVEMRAKYGEAPSQFVELSGGLTVHLRDEGPRDGLPIILLHGSNADLHTWQPWVDALKSDYRLIRIDQRGHGLTGAAPDGDYSSDAFVADIDAVADALGLEQFILIGHSMGGGFSVRYALAHPDRLTGIVLIDATGAPIKGEGSNLGFKLARMPVASTLMEHITPRWMVEKSLRQSVSNQQIATPEAIDRYWEMLRYPGNRGATIARFSLPLVPLTEQEVAGLDIPTLVIWGTEDAVISVEAGRWYDRVLTSQTYLEYEGIGHLPHEEAAQRSISDLRQWLEQLTQAAPVG